MIDRLLSFFGQTDELEDEARTRERVKHAAAVLLVEIGRADSRISPREVDEMRTQLCREFNLSQDEASDLLSRARETAEESVSLYEFTKLLHSELSYKEKESVIEMLWRIALADDELDKYEDYMISKIADLLYVARGDVIRLKHCVVDARR